MKKIQLTLLLLFTAGFLFSQEAKESVLKIEGSATKEVRPDQTVVSLSIKSQKLLYAEVVDDLSTRINLLEKELRSLKFTTEDIKTSSFSIVQVYTYEGGKRSQNGYSGQQSLTVKFKADKDLLAKVLNCAAKSNSDPEISIRYDLTEESRLNYRNELIRSAVKDARAKADILADESGYSISGLKEIIYGGTYSTPSPIYRTEALRTESSDIGTMEPEGLSLSESVQIIYILSRN